MKTLFEFRQIGESWGEEDTIEIKIYYDGSLFYKVNDDHMLNCFVKEKNPNEKLASDMAFLLKRHKTMIDNIPSELNDGKRYGYRHEIKLGEKLFWGNELQKIFTYEDTLKENAEAEDTIVQIIGLVKKMVDSAYPGFIDWDAISTRWFKNEKCSNYEFDGDYYCIENDCVVKKYDSDSWELKEFDGITVNQLKLYGKCTDPWAFEMKVLSIKTFEDPDWKALITAEDGAGIEISFWDDKYFDHPELYEIGKIGLYSICGDILNSPTPERQKQGVYLDVDEEERYREYIAGEKNTRGKKYKYIDDIDFALFSKSENFDETGVYNFRAVVNSPYYGEDENGEPNEKIVKGFSMALMNQIDKEYPRIINAQFDLENPYKGELEFGDGIKGVVKFSTGVLCSDNIGKYGENPTLAKEEKHPDTSEWEEAEE
ncbi:MAG: hypothetical protein J5747_09035 [Spirochaetaceae bacterium]|nr:hypothetical protein [Spirochaetaceae bacterium]